MVDDADEEEKELAIAANAESEKIRQKALKGKLRIGKSGSIASVAGSEKRIVFKEDGTPRNRSKRWAKTPIFCQEHGGERRCFARGGQDTHEKGSEERKTADYADRGREKARLREMRAKRKVKDVGKEETRAFLDVGGPSGSDDDDDDDEDGFGGRSDDDEEDEKPFDARAFKSVKRSDAAHAGMGRRTTQTTRKKKT